MEFVDKSEEKLPSEDVLTQDRADEVAEAEIENDYDDWCEDDEDETFQSLFSETKLPSINALIEHDVLNFGFDLKEVVKGTCDDEIAFIKLINFIRRSHQESKMSPSELAIIIQSKAFLEDDNNMKPVLPTDNLLLNFEDVFVFSVDQDEADAQQAPITRSEEEIAAALDALEKAESS